MRELLVISERIAALLKDRKETVAVAESAAGGLITAALLAVPGASAYCLGGIVIYTRQAWEAVRDFEEGLLEGHRSATATVSFRCLSTAAMRSETARSSRIPLFSTQEEQ